MNIINPNIVVFDFETGGLDPNFHEAIQIAGKAYKFATLEPYDDGEFVSLMKPLHPERLQEDALRVNKKTKDELLAAPDQGVVWNKFVEFVNKWNPKGNGYTAPIAAGKNIRKFDLRFAQVLTKLHCPKKEKTVLFSPKWDIDLEDFLLGWHYGNPDLPDMKMDTVREYFGLSREGAHDALVDVRQTGTLIMRFLRMQRQYRPRVQWRAGAA